MIRFRQKQMSEEGSLEWKATVPNPVEPEFPWEVRIDIFCIPDNEPERLFRTHALLDKREVFRFYSSTAEEAKTKSVNGLREFVASIAKLVSESEVK